MYIYIYIYIYVFIHSFDDSCVCACVCICVCMCVYVIYRSYVHGEGRCPRLSSPLAVLPVHSVALSSLSCCSLLGLFYAILQYNTIS